jgi:hypothetical protein
MRRLLVIVVACSMLWAGCNPAGGTRRRDGGGGGDEDGGGVLTDTGHPADWPDIGPLPDTGPPPPGDADDDGLPDADELARGTDPANADSDGDGLPDGVEVVAGTDPLDSGSFIPPTDFYVVLPYMDPEVHRELDFRARLGRADIFFLVDTTGSMGLAISNVSTSLSGTIVPAINDAIVDAVMGVGDFRDFDDGVHGDVGDWTFITRQSMTNDVAAVQTALNALRAGGGNDGPESSTEALYGSVAGACSPSPGAAFGFGGACFRDTSHPIIVHVTDADFHNGPPGVCDSPPCDYPAGEGRSWTETVAALNAQSVKIVGVAVDSFPFPGFPVASRNDLDALCTATDSRASDGSLTVSTAASGNVSTSVVDGIVDLIGASTQDVSARSLDDTSDAVDATRFITAITPVRATRAVSFDSTTFYGVAGGTQVTFDVTFVNDFQPETSRVQLFRAYIEVYDVASTTALDRRNVYIVIPAEGGVLVI